MTFETIFNTAPVLLTEGAIVERLKWEYSLNVDPHVNHAGLVYEAPAHLETLYRQYIDIACRFDLPVMVMTPTRRVNALTQAESPYAEKELIRDCCVFLKNIKAKYPDSADIIMAGGLLGCKGDAYSKDNALSAADAYDFHIRQAEQFAVQSPDFLFAGIMPVVTEALGMAQALAKTGIPYIISFMIRNTGRLLDDTPISEAIEIIDSAVDPCPVCYMANCVHPLNVYKALSKPFNKNASGLARFQGIQANASMRSPEELNQSSDLEQGGFEDLVTHMHNLQTDFGLKILGGCCGTDDHFLTMLAQKCGKESQ